MGKHEAPNPKSQRDFVEAGCFCETGNPSLARVVGSRCARPNLRMRRVVREPTRRILAAPKKKARKQSVPGGRRTMIASGAIGHTLNQTNRSGVHALRFDIATIRKSSAWHPCLLQIPVKDRSPPASRVSLLSSKKGIITHACRCEPALASSVGET